jgi:DnaJ-class molecular chaperone
MNNYYQILGCQPNSAPEGLRKAWRKKCREHHPDLGGSNEKFLEIMHAYKMLTDPSYQYKNKNENVRDLTFNVHIAINFLEAFYGTKITVNYNRVYLDGALEQIKSDIIEPISVSFDIDPGSTSGLLHRVQGNGMVCGTQVGDLAITVNIRRHPRYSVSGIDVLCDEEVPLDIMLKGGEIVVDTLWGHKVIWIPPGTMPGDKVRIYECGVAKKGYQYCTVKPVFPNQAELKKETWKGLNINWEKVEEKNKEDQELFDKFEALKKEKK